MTTAAAQERAERRTTGADSVRRFRFGARERGDTSLEIALYAPLMLLAILVVVQAAAWGLADLAAGHAADHALQTARVDGATASDGQQAAADLLAEINSHGLTEVDIHVTRNADTTTVTLTGTAAQVIPLVSIPVQARASGPTEPTG